MVTQAASKAKQEKAAKKEAKKEVKKEVAKVAQVAKAKPKKKKVRAVKESASKPVVSTTAAPAAFGRKERNYFNVKPLPGAKTGVRIRGCEFLDSVTTSTTQVVGDVLFNGPINPLAFVGTRLAVMATTFEKYRFNRFKVIAVPFVGTSVTGGYGLAYDRDPSDSTPTGGLQAIRAFNAMPNTVEGSLWESLSIDCPIMDPTTDYFTNAISSSDERLVDQGQLYMFCTTAITTAVNFNLLIEYDLSMWIPELSPTLASAKYGSQTTGTATNWQQYNMFQCMSSANPLAGWTVASPLGDTGRLPIEVAPIDPVANPAGTNYGLKLPGGLWSVGQIMEAVGTWTAGFNPSIPSFIAVDPREAADFANTALNVFTSAATGAGVQQVVTAIHELLIPPSGGWLMGRWTGTQPTALTAGSVLMNLLVAPSRMSPTLSLALVHVGKWKRNALTQHRKDEDEKAKREQERQVRLLEAKAPEVAPPVNSVQQGYQTGPGLQLAPTGTVNSVQTLANLPQPQYSPQNISSPSMPTFRQ